MKKSFIGKLYGNYNKNWKQSQEKGEESGDTCKTKMLV